MIDRQSSPGRFGRVILLVTTALLIVAETPLYASAPVSEKVTRLLEKGREHLKEGEAKKAERAFRRLQAARLIH